MNGRVVGGFLAVAIVPLVLLVDVAVTFARGWWTTSSMWLGITIASALVLAFATFRLATARGRAWYRRRCVPLIVFGATLMGSWLAAEWVIGKAFGASLYFHRSLPGTVRVFQPRSDVMPGIVGESRYTANSLGIRGPELPADAAAGLRVLCVGGSTTACLYLDDSEAWPRRLADRRGDAARWGGDVGKSGYGTWHHVRFLEEQALLERFDAAVFLVGINDLMRAIQGRRIESPFGVRPLWERSRIYAVLYNHYQARKDARRHLTETPDGSIYISRRQERAAAVKSERLPDLSSGLAEYRLNLKTMIEACRAASVRPIFVTQPVLWTPDLDASLEASLWLGRLADKSFLSAAALARGMRKFNQALVEVCAAEGVTCVDSSALDGSAEWFFDDCHFTEAGANAIAELLVAAIRTGPR